MALSKIDLLNFTEMASPRTSKEKKLTFEQSMARLEEISTRLNNPETGLEETIALVEEGRKLIATGRALLNQAELRITQLDNPVEPLVPAPAVTQKDDDNGFTLI